MCHKHNTALFVRTGQSVSSALQHLGATMIKTDVSKKKKNLLFTWQDRGCIVGWVGVALQEEDGRASLNRAIFMLTEQNTYNVKWVA